MLTGLVLFFVGVVLVLNGLSLLGRVGTREVVVINLLVGLLTLRVAHDYAFGPDANLASVRDATLALLFSFTYLWNADNQATASDGRGLGWFSLIVALTAAAVSARLASQAVDLWSAWQALSWAAWAVLWLLFFLLQVYRQPWTRLTGWTAIAQGLLTGLLPAFWLLEI